MVAPKLLHREALNVEVEDFIVCVSSRSQPISDGKAGVKVLRVLEAAQLSLKKDGERIKLEDF